MRRTFGILCNNRYLRIGAPAWLALILGLVMMTQGAAAVAQENPSRTVYIAGSGNAALDQHVLDLFQTAFGPETELQTISDEQASLIDRAPIITIGPKAFSHIRQTNRDASVLAFLVQKSFIQKYTEEYPGQISAVFYDVPLLRQALAGKAILPHASRIAILASPESVGVYEPLLDQLPAFDLQARVFVVDSMDRLIPTLVRALNYGDFLLASHDESIYNPRTIKHILLTAYRRNRIVIGPSQAYVKAGSLASGYAPFQEMADVAAQLIGQFFETGRLPPPTYPQDYRISLNRQVARSLNIPLPDANEITRFINDALAQHGRDEDE